MSDDFTKPEPCRLPLSDGQFVDIKRRLNHGETEDMYARISPYGVGVNRREVRTAKIAAYLLGWSLTRDGKPVPMTPLGGDMDEQERIDTIRGLDPDRAAEIHKAIEAHEDAEAAARAALKKTPGGTPAGEPISSSHSAPAGASSGSVPSTSTTTTDS
jgi:hypothetical protein